MKSFKQIIYSVLLYSFFCIVFSSCEVGLGSTVDVAPPSVVINDPKVDMKVRQAFVMSGTWSDDLGISSINVTLENANDKSQKYEFLAEKSDGKKNGDNFTGTWTCLINPLDPTYYIPDGIYTAKVAAIDTYDRNSDIATQTFSIDNTAPLVVLESPKTISISNPNAFGQILNVKAAAADDSEVDSIDFVFYDDNKNELYRENIKSNNQIELSIAKWGDTVYNTIYGKNKEAGTKNYYLGMITYDSARCVPEVENDKGNSTSKFYMYDTLEEFLLGVSDSVQTSVGYDVLSSRSATFIEKSELNKKWKEALETKFEETATFSLNPVNNPYFDVQRLEGFKQNQGELDNIEFTNKNTLSVNIYRGRDNKAIKKDTIGVYLVESDSKGQIQKNAKKVPLLLPYIDENGNINSNVNQIEHENQIKLYGDIYTISFSVNNETFNDLRFNQHYVIEVVAFDINGMGIFNELNYGFKFVTTATPPIIKITYPKDSGNLGLNKNTKISGIINTQEDNVNVTLYKEQNIEQNKFSETRTIEYSSEVDGFPFEFIIDTNQIPNLPNSENLPKIIVEAISSSGQVSTQEIKVDKVLPVIGSETISPTVEQLVDGENKIFVNGTINMKIPLSDNQLISDVSYSLDDGNSWISLGSSTMFNADIDTIKFADNSQKIVKIKLTDSAANQSFKDITLNINQITDKPQIELSNADKNVKDSTKIDINTNLFGTVTNNKINGIITDDDGIKEFTLTIKQNDNIIGTPEKINGLNKTSLNFSKVLPSVPGVYSIFIDVVDCKEQTQHFTTNENFIFAVDKGSPQMSISTVSGAYQAGNSSFKINGLIDKECEITCYSDSEYKNSLGKATVTGESWEFVQKTDTNGKTIYFVAKDIYGQTTANSFSYKIDINSPTIKIDSIAGNDFDFNNLNCFASKSSLLTVKGSVSDIGESHLEEFIYYAVESTEPEKINDCYKIPSLSNNSEFSNSVWKKAQISTDTNGVSSWVANINLDEEKYIEGKTYNLFVAARDNAQNVSIINENQTCNKIKLTIDSISPIIQNVEHKSEDGKLWILVTAFDGESKLPNIVNGEYLDKVIQLTLNDKASTIKPNKNTTEKIIDEIEYTVYSILVPSSQFNASGITTYSVQIFDNAENTALSNKYSVSTGAPTTSIENVLVNNKKDSNNNYFVKDSFELPYKIIAEGNKIGSAWYITNNGEKQNLVKSQTDTENLWNGKIQITKPVKSSKYSTVVLAKNDYDNSNVSSLQNTLNYIFDLDKPVLYEIQKTGVNEQNYFDSSKQLTITGKAKDGENLENIEFQSGIESINYSLKKMNEDWTSSTQNLIINESVIGLENWKFNINLSEFDEGNYQVEIIAKDYVGNSSTKQIIKLIADKNPPVILPEKVNSFYGNNANGIKISGTINETFLSEFSIQVKKDEQIITPNKVLPKLLGQTGFTQNQNWSVTLPNESGSYEIIVNAKDKLGNSDSFTASTIIDNIAPEFTIQTINGKSYDSSVNYFGNLTDFFTVSGILSDNNGGTGLDQKIYYKTSKENLTLTDLTGFTDVAIKTTENGSTFEIPVKFDSFNPNDTVLIYFAIKDNAGNISFKDKNNVSKISVLLDQTPPVLSEPQIEIATGSKNAYVYFTAKDGENGSGIDESKTIFYKNNAKFNKSLTKNNDEYSFYILSEDLNPGENIFYIEFFDKAGNSKSSDRITIENNAPQFSDNSSGIPDTNYRISKKIGNVKYDYFYVNSQFTQKTKILLNGSCNSLYNVTYKDIYHEENGISTVLKELTQIESDINGFYSVTTDIQNEYEGKFVTRIFTAENIYGQKSTWETRFVFDSTKPVLKSDSGYELKIGEVLNTNLTTKWFNKDSLSISGNYNEDGSGIKEIQYKLIPNGKTENDAIEGTIFTSDKGSYEQFSSTLSGFIEGKNINTIILQAFDNAGNSSLQSSFSVNIDTTSPNQSDLQYKFEDESDYKTYNGTILTNKTKNLLFKGNFTDKNGDFKQSGIKSISLKINNKSIDANFTQNSTSGEWTAIIQTSDLGELANYSVDIELIDNAQNSTKTKLLDILVDTKKPVVKIESPSSDAILNGIITLSGKVNDENNVKSIKLYYFVGNEKPTKLSDYSQMKFDTNGNNLEKIVGINNVTLSDVTSWKFENVNINSVLQENVENGTLWIFPVAYDEAGNQSEAQETKTTVDLNSDRPVIKFSNLGWDAENSKPAGFIKYASELNGSITDDDGISVLKIANQQTIPEDWEEISEVPVSSGSFSFDLGDDGQKTLWFHIQDTQGGIFVTNDTKTTKQPYLLFNGNTEKQSNDSKLEFVTDSNAPSLSEFGFSFGDSQENSARKNDDSNFTELKSSVKTLAGGKTRKYIRLSLKASDSGSGIKSVKVKIDGIEDEITLSLNENIYVSRGIDVSSLHGQKEILFTVLDNANIETKETRQITFDNTAPNVELVSPTDEVTGNVTLKGTSSDEFSNISSINFYVPNDDDYSEGVLDNTKYEANAKNASSVNTGTAKSWIFNLDGKDNSNDALPSTEIQMTNFSKTPKIDENSDTLNLPIIFYVQDELGNSSFIKQTIKYNPFGNRPKTEVIYPSPEKGEFTEADFITDYSNVNGSIRITGATTDNTSLETAKVYIQLDVNKDGKFNNDDLTVLKSLEDYSVIENIVETGNDDSAITSKSETKWGILVNGTNSWSYTLNGSDELKFNSAQVSEGKFKIGVRAITVDSTGVFGNWSNSAYFLIDSNVPQILNNASLTSDNSGTDSGVSYKEDIFLQGNEENPKFLKIVAKDKTGIKKININYGEDINSMENTTIIDVKNNSIPDDFKVSDPEIVSGFKEYSVYIPASKLQSENGKLAMKVTVFKDSDSDSSSYERYVMNFDNTSPLINKITLNGANAVENDRMVNKIVNSNGSFFTLGGQIQDEGAGFERMAFYFYRDKQNTQGNKRRVFDPMSSEDSTIQVTNDDSTALLSGFAIQNFGSEENTTPLYGYEQNVSISNNGTKITVTSINQRIRTGGIVKINNVWHRIDSISGNDLTISPNTTATSNQTAFFPIAQIIDNTSIEKTNSSGELLDDGSDDGDGMPESVIKSGINWNFDASIHSNYISDGPVTLVVIAWDKAGNVQTQKIDSSVQNNAPRLTKLWLATSLNGFSDANRFTQYDVLSKVGAKSSYEMNTADYKSRFRVKGDLALVTEFTGGNNASNSTDKSQIKLAFNNSAENETSGYKTAESSELITNNTSISENNDFIHSMGTNFDDLSNFAFVIPKENLGNDSESVESGMTKRAMSFTFWDDTDETTQGQDSSYCYLKLCDLIVMIEDNFAPTVTIDPFYWKNPNDNSLYQNDYLQGHIDLEGYSENSAILDLETGMFKINDEFVTGTPQVSGYVSFRGKALDGHKLDEIKVKFGDEDEISVAEYDDNLKKMIAKNDSGFIILSESEVEEGHLIEWQYDLNTTQMLGERTFKIIATDAANSPHISSDDATGKVLTKEGKYNILLDGTNIPSYTVNLVPYISGVQNANRSRLGKYLVRTGEQITLTGFNLGEASSTVTVTRHKTNNLGKLDSTQTQNITVSSHDSSSISFTSPTYSGFINVSIDGQPVPNNTNNNVAYNIQNGYEATDSSTYGKTKADKNGANFWTDDIYLSVWNSGTTFKESTNPIKGTMEKLMKSYTKYIDLTKHTNNNTLSDYGLVGVWGGENNMMYDNILGNNTRGKNVSKNSSGEFGTPPSQVDVCVVNGNYFYVILDDTWKDAGTFGQGLGIFRDGWEYQNHDSGNYKYSIEKTSEDKVRDQFQNPKIAGLFLNNQYHIYTSYYDKYTHCLKFAKLQLRDTIGPNNDDLIDKYSMSYETGKNQCVVDGEDTTSSENSFGQWSDIKIVAKNNTAIPVIAYYVSDGIGSGTVKIAQGKSTAPQSNSSTGWTYSTVSKPSGANDFGRYVSMEMDSSGGLHITAQDATNGILYYGYLTETNGEYSLDSNGWQAVDSTNSVGRWTDIKLEDSSQTGLNCKPVITYQNAGKLNTVEAIKIAYLDFENSWEAQTSPTVFEPNDEKLSLVITANDTNNVKNRYAIGFNSNQFAVDFLRDE